MEQTKCDTPHYHKTDKSDVNMKDDNARLGNELNFLAREKKY